MNLVRKVTTIAGLAGALALGGLAAAPAAHAQVYIVHGRAAQMRQAARLDRQATVQADRGHFAKAAQLHRRAAALRTAARRGY